MKDLVGLLIIVIILIGASLYTSVGIDASRPADTYDQKRLEELSLRFAIETPNEDQIDFSKLFVSRNLFHPPIRSLDWLTGDKEYSSCEKLRPKSGENDKTLLWESKNCLNESYFDENFLTSPPFLHPSGSSYALMIFEKYGRFISKDSHFISENRFEFYASHFHVGELGAFIGKKKTQSFSLPEKFKKAHALYLLSPRFLEKKILADFDNSKLYVRFDEGANLSFSEYSLEEYQNFMGKNNFSIFYSSDLVEPKCYFAQIGNFCVEKNFLSVIANSKSRFTTLLYSLIALLGLVFVMIFIRIRAQYHKALRNRHAFELLAHEIRTPITKMLLFSNESSKLLSKVLDSESGKTTNAENLRRLNISLAQSNRELYQLQRLSQISHQIVDYSDGQSLKINSAKNQNFSESTRIPSLNQFLREKTEKFSEDICLQLLESDSSLKVDPFWLSICLENLIGNAFKHGHGKVSVGIGIKNFSTPKSKRGFLTRFNFSRRKPKLELWVEDEGQFSYFRTQLGQSLDFLLAAKTKTAASESSTTPPSNQPLSLGKGLKLTRNLTEKLGGKFKSQSTPNTRFTLEFPMEGDLQ